MISWKYTFKRLNEEYELATKKKQAIDSLCLSGKISQQTRDTFTEDIVKAITEIEKQRQDLGEKMQTKTQELENQLKTLEMLLANYEIQHVVGEIDEEIYAREINLLSITLETTKNELGVIKDATNQLFGISKPAEAPPTPEITPPTTETPVESAPMDIPVETATIESPIVETVPAAENTSVEPTPIETTTIETIPEQITIETAPIETPTETPTTIPIETAEITVPAEASLTETVVEVAVVDVATEASVDAVVETSVDAAVEVAVVEAPLEEVAVVDVATEVTSVDIFAEAPCEVQAEMSLTEVAPAGEAQIAPAEALPIEVTVLDVPAVEETFVVETETPVGIAEAVAVEVAIEEPVAEASLVIEEPIVGESFEAAIVDVAPEIIAPAEAVVEQVMETSPDPVVEAPLQVFEVTEHAPIETTLEKIMEPAIEEPIIQSVIVEEVHVPAHPLEAPQQAHSDEMVDMETDTVQTTPTDENDENTTTTE